MLAEDGKFLGTSPVNAAALQNVLSLPIARSSAASANVRGQILRGNLEDGLPAQFVVVHADCGLYWTAPMITDITEVWNAAAGAALNNTECANGGIEHRAPKTYVRPTANSKLPMANVIPKAGDSTRSSGLWNAKRLAGTLNFLRLTSLSILLEMVR